ncbi:hypothetical protein [Microbacterium sp. P5_E9]
MTEHVQSSADVVALADRIMKMRLRPLVVVSTDPHTGVVAHDQAELERELADIAELFLIPTGDLTRELDSLLPDKTQVYGGAGRSYPHDFITDPHWRRSPLRFPSAKATQQLIGDVLGHAGAAGLFAKPSERRVAASGVVKGFIADGTRAIVDVDGRGHATISSELTYPPIPLEWSLHTGQRVTGVLDLDAKLMLVETPRPTQADLEKAFPHRCVTLALVRKVTAARATLLLHPAVEFVLRGRDISPNPLDTVDLLVAEGDVVAARVTHLSDGTLHLSLVDVDDDDPIVPPLALTAGGRPWLAKGRALELQTMDAATELAALDESAATSAPAGPGGAEADAPATAGALVQAAAGASVGGGEAAASLLTEPGLARAARPMPGPGRRVIASAPEAVVEPEPVAVEPVLAAAPGTALQTTQLQLATERARSAELERRLAEAGADDSQLSRLRALASGAETRLREELAERGELERQLKELKDQRRQGTQALREARRAAPVAPTEGRGDRRARWATDEAWVHHEVYLAWVDRVEPSERESWPLADFEVGPEFAASLTPLDEGQFDKAMRAVVDAVTGRIRQIPGRELHALRSGDGGADPDLVRGDGAKCYRAAIEQRTPAARRVHFWALPGGGVELSRVVTHDDVRP